jgi:hypothetical protein
MQRAKMARPNPTNRVSGLASRNSVALLMSVVVSVVVWS